MSAPSPLSSRPHKLRALRYSPIPPFSPRAPDQLSVPEKLVPLPFSATKASNSCPTRLRHIGLDRGCLFQDVEVKASIRCLKKLLNFLCLLTHACLHLGPDFRGRSCKGSPIGDDELVVDLLVRARHLVDVSIGLIAWSLPRPLLHPHLGQLTSLLQELAAHRHLQCFTSCWHLLVLTSFRRSLATFSRR